MLFIVKGKAAATGVYGVTEVMEEDDEEGVRLLGWVSKEVCIAAIAFLLPKTLPNP